MTDTAPKFIQANGLRFAYLEEGQGPLVLLVHGFPDTAHTWDAVRPAVAAAGFRAVSPFTRGYFPTAIPAVAAYDTDTLARDILSLIEALGEKQAVVIGHDFGAGAAYSAAGLQPEKVRKLVTVAIPHPATVVPTPRLLWAVRHFATFNLPGAVERTRRNGYAHLDELVQRWSPAWKVPLGETDAVKAAFAQPGCLEAAVAYYRAISPFMPEGQKAPIRVPTTAFAGEQDIVPTHAYDRARRQFTSSYEVVKMPGGHFMHREHPEHFIRELLRVLGPPSAA